MLCNSPLPIKADVMPDPFTFWMNGDSSHLLRPSASG